MGKTTRRQPEWLKQEDKGAKPLKGPSRKTSKQHFLREAEELYDKVSNRR